MSTPLMIDKMLQQLKMGLAILISYKLKKGLKQQEKKMIGVCKVIIAPTIIGCFIE